MWRRDFPNDNEAFSEPTKEHRRAFDLATMIAEALRRSMEMLTVPQQREIQQMVSGVFRRRLPATDSREEAIRRHMEGEG